MGSFLFIYQSSINEPLWNILSKLSLDNKRTYLIVSAIKNYFDDKSFKDSDSIFIKVLKDSTILLNLKKDFDELEIILKDTIKSEVYKKGFIQKKLEIAKGIIVDNLYYSLIKLNEKPEIVEKFADIFAWDIDFTTETENGDSFLILVEKLYYNEKFVGYGNIIYGVYFSKRLGKKTAIRFENKYYSEDGKALQKMFLRSPLKIYRISSYMGYRFHPILKVYRMHHGVDYSAPYGTPVHSLGPGVVVFSGWKGGYGKTVIIRHPNGYETLYGHLSKIVVNIGQRVMAGDYIGNVGSTGLSTGPHLHLEMRKNGNLINPLKLKIPSDKSIEKEKINEFTKLKERIINFISNSSMTFLH